MKGWASLQNLKDLAEKQSFSNDCALRKLCMVCES